MKLLTDWFQHRLRTLGYPKDDVRYSLGYCQGDGMAFYGRVDVKVVGPRLCPGFPAQVWEGMQHPVELEDSGIRYHHWNSMSISLDCDTVTAMDGDEFGGIAKRIAMHRLLECLEDDVKNTSRELEREGYRLIEASPYEESVLIEKETRCFRVVVTKLRDEHYEIDDSDSEYFEADVRSLIDGKTEYFCLKAEVFSRYPGDDWDDLPVSEFILGGVEAQLGDRFANGVLREVVSEAVFKTRRKLRMVKPHPVMAIAA